MLPLPETTCCGCSVCVGSAFCVASAPWTVWTAPCSAPVACASVPGSTAAGVGVMVRSALVGVAVGTTCTTCWVGVGSGVGSGVGVGVGVLTGVCVTPRSSAERPK